ncbi:PTS IIA-like nitrogen regulatory protein PtsN [Gilvimarinus agarilyticus]|uniref:PTS IIA-like nitrogen regulatory protein PtsN n=1 Tax=unclassified Gilvimarinus TaxID=2642066 RepID=UPI001C07F713|nr:MULTISPECIES: PTS IIA-like nitrogen regulatory protein PtsN [unclassified Gilvimarinus]MBU2885439.1 PTS IIA-like nitrogen regulatory protein PtsN [Gilvimarinus agarilyticus]MDO6570339.1 PTS IIA-like nitrogen regulatory protein PtsN [Gilvimarinus sp. 2_MG-2023]MDO6746874.1 PTS IIA-like nitrogen regulatory protein PtsN [Gilvimarinus sp. 1_MG-2023]
MEISQILSPERTLCHIEGVSKKRALEILANTIAENSPMLDADDVFRRLIAREKLGSTGIGHGIAIPHSRIPGCDCTLGALITLKDPIDFDAMDGEPVDVLFAMLVPEESCDEHLKTLAALASALNDNQFRQALRSAQNPQALFAAATQSPAG